MNPQTEEIQPGWTVFGSDGGELGKVVAVDAMTLRVKKGGLLGREVSMPRSSVADVEVAALNCL